MTDSSETAKAQVPDRKNCHICGCLLNGKCLSCGHEQCDECPVHVPKPSYEELEAECKRMLENFGAAHEANLMLLTQATALTAECKRLRNPITLTEKLTHGRACRADYDLDTDCTCGLQYRIQLQTEQEMHAAWMKRALESEAENAKMREALGPVTVAERKAYASAPISRGMFACADINALLSARAQKAGAK